MGAWGIHVLENDTALDMMWELNKDNYVSKVNYCLTSDHVDPQHIGLLGAALVYMQVTRSLGNTIFDNKFYDYEELFNYISQRNDLLPYKEKALKIVQDLISDTYILDWDKECRIPRKSLLQSMVNVLKEN